MAHPFSLRESAAVRGAVCESTALPDAGPPAVYGWVCAGAMALALLVTATIVAEAKSARRPADPVAAQPVAAPAARPPASGPARFFTINEILAKRDRDPAQAGGRTAALDPGEPGTSDADTAARRVVGPEPFGLHAFRAPDGLLWRKWRGLEAELAAEARSLADCRGAQICGEAAKRYLGIIEEVRGRDGRARLETANRLLNRAIRYVSDGEQHGEPDRWQAPLAALAAGRGDCEEYAIAKYAALRDAGVPESELRLVLVRDTAIRVDHAVLAARFEGRWLVLDNRRDAVAETEDLRHYMPLYALDREGVKLFAAPYAMWGEAGAEFAGWMLRGTEGEEFAAWSLRGSDAEPAASF